LPVTVLVLIVVVLERTYHAKVPVKVFGIEINQPTVKIAATTLRWTKPLTVHGTEKESLGIKQSEGFCYITEIKGNFGGAEYVRVFVDPKNDTWTLQSNEGRSGTGVEGTAQCVVYSKEEGNE
jgi:hypothetical protein